MGFLARFGASAMAATAAKVIANKSVEDIHELFTNMDIPIDKVMEYCGLFVSNQDLDRLKAILGSNVTINIGDILTDMGFAPREFAALLKEPKGIDKAKVLFNERMALLEGQHADGD